MTTNQEDLSVRAFRAAGVMTVLATPFQADGTLDVPSLQRLVEHQIEGGVDGLVCFGLAGEGYKLADGERDTVLREVVRVAAGAVPVFASAEHNSIHAAVERTCRSLDAGASGVMAYPPTFVPGAPDEVVAYYDAIGSTGAEVVVQDAPAWTRTPLPVDLLGRIDRVAGGVTVKVEVLPSAPKVRALGALGIRTIGGYGALHLAEDLAAGVGGVMPGSAGPERFAAIWRDHLAGDVAAVKAGWRRALPLIAFQMQSLDVFVAAEKLLLHRAGIIADPSLRSPGQPLTADQVTWLDQLVEDCAR